MKNLFFNTQALDKCANTEFKISSEILMENAASGMYGFLTKLSLVKSQKKPRILFVCGSGDNGADCLALARMCCGVFNIFVFLPLGVKSVLCKAQKERLEAILKHYPKSFQIIESLESYNTFDIIIDGLFGTGFKGTMDCKIAQILEQINAIKGIKIACDIPSGITQNGELSSSVFKADFTLTMGALKCALYEDATQDYVGKIICLNLGLNAQIYAHNSPFKLLEKKDFIPPKRNKNSTNKGDFGHLAVFLGEKQGAGILSALSALRSGCGLVSVVSNTPIQNLPFSLMQTQALPKNTTAIALGMGFGYTTSLLQFDTKIPLLLDADIFYHSSFLTLLTTHKTLILTPHPKEFTQILKSINLAHITTQTLQTQRIHYALEFSKAYPNVILVLKGANTIIAHDQNIYIHPFANNTLAKGGSGDVLAGLIGSYLAQGYNALESAIYGVMLQGICAKKYAKKYNNFSLTPLDLIEQLRYI